MGCSGSTPKPRKATGAVRRKKTTIKKSNVQARQQVPVQKSSVQTHNSGSGAIKKVTKSEAPMISKKATVVKGEEATKAAAGPVKKPTAQIVVSNNFNTEDINSIVEGYKNEKDRDVCGDTPESVLLFDKDNYNTENWSNVLFAINNKDLRAVRYFIEHKRYHRRLSTRKRELGIDETIYDAEVFCLIIAISNQDKAMLDYLWSMNELWDYEHLKIVLQVIFTRNLWTEGMQILLGSEATQDIFNSLSYMEKKQFILELFYRYLHYAPEDIQEYIKSVSLQQPYSLIAMLHLMTEHDPKSIDLIEEAMEYITLQDYAKMKYEAELEFIKDYNGIYNQFIVRTEEFEDIAKQVKK